MRRQESTSIRISPDGKEILRRISRHMGINQTAVIEVAIRKLARSEGVNIEDLLLEEKEEVDTQK